MNAERIFFVENRVWRRFMLLCLLLPGLPCVGEDGVGSGAGPAANLRELKRLALVGNPDVVAAGARVRLATEKIREARAAYFPVLSYSASMEDQSRTTASILRGAEDENTDAYAGTVYAQGLQVSWTLFDGFMSTFELLQKNLDKDQSCAVEQDARRLLVAAVSSGYYAWQAAQANRCTAEGSLQLSRELLDLCNQRLLGGVALEADLLNFQVRVNLAEIELAEADYARSTAQAALNALVGSPVVPLAEPTKEPGPLPVVDLLLAEALDHRPDLRALRLARSEAEAGVKKERAGFFPEVKAFGNLSYLDEDGLSLSEDDQQTLIGVSFSWPLFEGGRVRARMAAAAASVETADAVLAARLATVRKEMETAHAMVRLWQPAERLHRENVRLTRHLQDLTRKRYESGLENLARLNQVLNDAVTAEQRLNMAAASLAVAWENLRAATGVNLQGLE